MLLSSLQAPVQPPLFNVWHVGALASPMVFSLALGTEVNLALGTGTRLADCFVRGVNEDLAIFSRTGDLI